MTLPSLLRAEWYSAHGLPHPAFAEPVGDGWQEWKYAPVTSLTSGESIVDKKEVLPAPQARDAEAARRLWEVSLIQTGLQLAPGGAVAAP
jgi:hypothetical protein